MSLKPGMKGISSVTAPRILPGTSWEQLLGGLEDMQGPNTHTSEAKPLPDQLCQQPLKCVLLKWCVLPAASLILFLGAIVQLFLFGKCPQSKPPDAVQLIVLKIRHLREGWRYVLAFCYCNKIPKIDNF